jgi:hypothetical protein
MLRRYFIYFTFALLFALTQQAAVTHEISHISDVQQSSQKQDKTTHSNFCEKCLSFGDLANSISSKHFSISLSVFNFDLIIHTCVQDFSNTYAAYSARAPPSHA